MKHSILAISILAALSTTAIAKDIEYVSVLSQGAQANKLNEGAQAPNTVAVGPSALAKGIGAVAVGTDVKALGGSSVVIGTNSSADANGTVAIGHDTKVSGNLSTAIGHKARATLAMGTAVGSDAQANGESSVAYGKGSRANGKASTANGPHAIANGVSSTAMGLHAAATGDQSTAIGQSSSAAGDQSAAFGSGAVTESRFATALGTNAKALNQHDVALGSGSKTAQAVGTTKAVVDSVTLKEFAGTKPVANVSVGNKGYERTITNVAAGRITKDSTDAVNGSQVHALLREADRQNKVDAQLDKRIDSNAKQIKKNADGVATNAKQIAGLDKRVDSNSKQIANNARQIANVDNRVTQLKEQYVKPNQKAIAENKEAIGKNTEAIKEHTQTLLIHSGVLEDHTNKLNQGITFRGDAGSTESKLGETLFLYGGNGSKPTVGGNIGITAEDGQINVELTKDIDLGSEGSVTMGDVNVSGYGIIAGNKTISKVANGVKADDAVNKGQLDAVASKAAKDAKAAKTEVKAGNNIVVDRNVGKDGQDVYTVRTSRNVVFDKAAVGDVVIDKVDGIHAGNKVVKGVADGAVHATSTEAVNGRQLDAVNKKVDWNTTAIERLKAWQNGELQALKRDMAAGAANSIAQANVPQAVEPGQSSVGLGLGNYRNEGAVAVGLSHVSDSGNWIVKGTASFDTRKKVGLGLGVAYAWGAKPTAVMSAPVTHVHPVKEVVRTEVIVREVEPAPKKERRIRG